MADRREKKARNTNSKVIDFLSENPFGDVIELDSVDWGAVARSYKILRLSASDSGTFERNDKLKEDYERWMAKRVNTVEFDIALRMHFDEAAAIHELLANTDDASLNPTVLQLISGDYNKFTAEI